MRLVDSAHGLPLRVMKYKETVLNATHCPEEDQKTSATQSKCRHKIAAHPSAGSRELIFIDLYPARNVFTSLAKTKLKVLQLLIQ